MISGRDGAGAGGLEAAVADELDGACAGAMKEACACVFVSPRTSCEIIMQRRHEYLPLK